MKSIERLLLVWVLGALTLGVAALWARATGSPTRNWAKSSTRNLKQVALATAYHHDVGAQPMTSAPGQATSNSLLRQLPQIYDSDGEFDFVTLVWKTDGTLLFTSDPTIDIPFAATTGIPVLGRSDGEWHIYSIVKADSVIQAAQRDSSRSILAAEVASKMLPPLAALVLLIAAMLVLALRRGLRSLDDAANSVAQRTELTLKPISPAQMPREIHPLIHSINDLLSRLSLAFETQQRFVADAAHELRTPVTALRLQIQLLERARTMQRKRWR